MREAELNAKLFGLANRATIFFLCGDIVIVNDVLFLSSWDRHSISFSLRRLLHFLNRGTRNLFFALRKKLRNFDQPPKLVGLGCKIYSNSCNNLAIKELFVNQLMCIAH